MTTIDTDLVVDEEALAEMMRLTHIVSPSDNPELWLVVAFNEKITFSDVTSQMIVNLARAKTLPVRALCGYTFVPIHNPEKYDVCSGCMEEAQRRMQAAGE